jgi:hypothetical protein
MIVVMDQFSRRIVGFAVAAGPMSGEDLCYMFNQIIGGKAPPRYLSCDNDPLYKFHRWQTNMEILGIKEVRSIPFTPTSHPFVERAIGTTRREFLDQYCSGMKQILRENYRAIASTSTRQGFTEPPL